MKDHTYVTCSSVMGKGNIVGCEPDAGCHSCGEPESVHDRSMVSIPPSWRGILSALLVLYNNGDYDARTEARRELVHMAMLADLHVAEQHGKGVLD